MKSSTKPICPINLPKFHPKQQLAFDTEATEILFGGSTRGGKALAIETPILTPNGFKPMGEILVGEYVVGADGNPTLVTNVSNIELKNCYNVTFDNGEVVTACEDHLWVTQTRKERSSLFVNAFLRTTKDIFNSVEERHSIAGCEETPETEPYINPKTPYHFIKKVEPVGKKWVKCISVDNDDKLYLCSKSLIPTHNSFFVRAALILWSASIPGLQSVIFRLSFDDVIANHMQSDKGFPALLAPWIREGLVTCTQTEVRFNFNGSLITLMHLSDERALLKAQGVARHVMVFEEATQIKESYIRWIRAWCSMDEDMKAKVPPMWKDRFPKLIYTSNPIGTSASYFRRHFVKPAPRMTIFDAPIEEGGFKRIYIPALVTDNPSEDAEATRRRVSGMGDPALVKALLEEDWDSSMGEFMPQFDSKIHMVDNFSPPKHWFKFITFDWGSNDPFACYWWAVSDGQEFKDQNGKERWFPRGSLIAYREWYGCLSENPSKGLGMRNSDIAEGIIKRTGNDKMSGLVLTDNAPFQDRGMEKGGRKYTISDVFLEHGVKLTKGNTARRFGWGEMKSRLIGKDGLPLLYFVHNCRWANEYIPSLARSKDDQEDAEIDGEATHCCDAIRIACATRPIVKDKKQEAPERTIGMSESPMEILKRIKRQRYARY